MAKQVQDAYIVAATRTPVGKAPRGMYRNTRPDDMLAHVLKSAIGRCPGLEPGAVEDVIVGCAMPEAEQGMNVARIGLLLAGFPDSVSGMTINRFCSSGLQAVALAADRIRLGEAEVMIAAGTESMSMVPMGGNKPSFSPAIFEKEIAGSSDYREMLEAPEAGALDAKTLYEMLAVRDIQDACDARRPVYEQTARRDGYVSLSPFLAHDTLGTLNEARRLWSAVGRDNLMIKVPATAAGIPAIRQLICHGINVNVTLLFDLAAYEQVAAAYLSGLEELVARGGDPTRVASVASAASTPPSMP